MGTREEFRCFAFQHGLENSATKPSIPESRKKSRVQNATQRVGEIDLFEDLYEERGEVFVLPFERLAEHIVEVIIVVNGDVVL